MNLRRFARAAATTLAAAGIVTVGMVSPAHAESPGRTYDDYRGNVPVHVAFAAQWINAGDSWYFGNSRMTMQTDGNLVIYHRWVKDNGKPRVLWATGTNGKGGVKVRFQKDGNFVIYKKDGKTAVWASKTANKCNDFAWSPVIGLQGDGNFVIYCAPVRAADNMPADSFKVLWSPNVKS
ncbi:hypothetical protein [Kineosporia babensis]|uniref:Bulb-type lectin domain-containing protein n=1 Tax=Kineosporia babensis TaxID=499548 RepID=A0A9X1NNW2_9ACTN|nr:hypothetical protein [Kineosporia babensis]MCD5316581.1 hypothetical protein [Kineosporia babensis]